MVTGFAWFMAEWVNPASAPAIVFTIGLLAAYAWPALAGAFRSRRGRARRLTSSASDRPGRGLRHEIVLLGIVPTLAFDPVTSRCSLCPPNLLAVTSDPGLVTGATRLGFGLQAAWVVGALALIVWGLAHASATERRRAAVVQVPAAVALTAAALAGLYSIPRGLISNDPVDIALWSVAALSLVAVAAGETAGWLRRRQTRQRVASLALELAAAPAAGELAPALGRELGDPTFEVLYPLDDGRLVDAAGIASVLPADATRSTTHVRRGGAPVAVLVHRTDLASTRTASRTPWMRRAWPSRTSACTPRVRHVCVELRNSRSADRLGRGGRAPAART